MDILKYLRQVFSDGLVVTPLVASEQTNNKCVIQRVCDPKVVCG